MSATPLDEAIIAELPSLAGLSWGVGGLEAEGAMFGLPLALRLPEVVGVRLTGALRPGRLGADVALTVTERLRKLGVVGKFVEFFGPGVAALSVGERGAIANMAPEYGATTGFFPLDARVLDYLRATGRDHGQLPDIEAYARRQGFWHNPDARRATPKSSSSTSGAHPEATTFASGPQDGAVAIAGITSCTNTTDPKMLIAAGLLARKARAGG
jgi:aconitate hydratase